MKRRSTVVAMPGDGIGRVVFPEALRVLAAVGFEADFVPAEIGWDCWVNEGNALPDRTVELLREHHLGLLGAITSKSKEKAESELRPELRGRGHVYTSPIVALRQKLHLDLCIRPCRSFAGNPVNFIRKSARGGIEEPRVDVVVFRQNTEGLFAGIEWTDPPTRVREALSLHPRFAPFHHTPGRDLALAVRVITRDASRRVLHAAFEYAHRNGYRAVTVCEKPNVLRETSGMFETEAQEAGRAYPLIALETTNIDAQMAWLTRNPEDFGVIVASNLFGDILSDAFAGLVGGLGFGCSANLGEDAAVFEPTHGSAEKYARLEPPIVNPIGMILSAAMLLDHVGEANNAERIRHAVAEVVREGKVLTYDMLRLTGGPDVLSEGAATTEQMTDAILSHC